MILVACFFDYEFREDFQSYCHRALAFQHSLGGDSVVWPGLPFCNVCLIIEIFQSVVASFTFCANLLISHTSPVIAAFRHNFMQALHYTWCRVYTTKYLQCTLPVCRIRYMLFKCAWYLKFKNTSREKHHILKTFIWKLIESSVHNSIWDHGEFFQLKVMNLVKTSIVFSSLGAVKKVWCQPK